MNLQLHTDLQAGIMKQNTKIYTLTHTLMLLVASFFWGTTFVAQSLGAEYVGAGTYLALRTYIGIIFLLPFVLYRDKKEVNNLGLGLQELQDKRSREKQAFLSLIHI